MSLAVCAFGAAKKKTAEPYGLIGVTVFHEPGFALPGAEVSVAPVSEDPQAQAKPFKGVSDARGECVFRVPTAAMRYTVRAAGKGYASQDKTVSVAGEQRIDVTFMLAGSSNH